MLLHDDNPSFLAGPGSRAPDADNKRGGTSEGGSTPLFTPLAPPQFVGGIDLLGPEAFLPTGGKEVLDADEPMPADKKAKEALQAIVTPAVKKAVRESALDEYLTSLSNLNIDVEQKLQVELETFLCNLRAWPLLTQIYLLATNELDSLEQQKKVQQLADLAVTWIPPKTGNNQNLINVIKGLPKQVKAIKDAQLALWKAQLAVPVTFTLYEYKVGDPNIESITWKGAVPVNPRVAKTTEVDVSDVNNPQLKGIPALTYPVPAAYLPIVQTPWSKSVWYAQVPGVADYKPFESYADKGVDNFTDQQSLLMQKFPKGNSTLSVKNKPTPEPSQEAKSWATDQALRLGVKTPAMGATSGGAFGARWQEWLVNMVDVGLQLDPEWGGSYELKTIYSILWSAVPTTRAAHAAARQKIMAPGVLEGDKWTGRGEWRLYIDAIDALETSIVYVCNGIPPLKWAWKKSDKTGLLEPSLDVDAWKTLVYEPKFPGYKTLAATLSLHKSDWFSNKAPTVEVLLDDLLGAMSQPEAGKLVKWTPGKGLSLPYGLVKSPVSQSALNLAQEGAKVAANASKSGLSLAQSNWVTARSKIKADILLSMKASQFATKSQAVTDTMVQTLSDMAIELYGCEIPTPPADADTPEKKLEYYKQELTACAKNPKEGSKAYTLKKMQEDYEALKKKAEAGDAQAAAARLALGEKIAQLQSEVSNLASRRGARRGRAEDNTTNEGGTFDLLKKSIDANNKAMARGGQVIDLDGKLKFTPGLSEAEKKAAEDTKTNNDKVVNDAKDSLGKIAGSGAAIETLAKDFNLPISETVIGAVQSNIAVAEGLVIPPPPPPPKKSNLWLWLLLGGAVAYSQSQK